MTWTVGGRLENVNRTTFTLVNTSSTTGSVRPCIFGRRTGRTVVRVGTARRDLARDKGFRFPASWIQLQSTSKRGLAGSAAPFCLSAPTSGTRVKIIFGGWEKNPLTFQLLGST